MRIVINAMSSREGGGQTYMINLLSNLPDRDDLEIHLFAPESLAIPADRRIIRSTTKWPTTNPLLRALWERMELPAYLRRVHADVLFCPGGLVSTKTPKGCRTVTMFRNMLPYDARACAELGWSLQRLRNSILRRVSLRSMSTADLTIFISDFARGVIEGLAKIPNPVTIPHGVAPAFRTYDRELPRPAAAGVGPYLLYVSRFDVYKHHREVVDAFAELSPDVRADLRLLLVGQLRNPVYQRVLDHVTALGLRDRVIFVGPVPYDQLPAFYRNAEAILFASSCENCPNILLEALGAGRPLLSSNVMPMPEFGGPSIEYFSPFDSDNIRQALERVRTDKDHADRVAAAAAERSWMYEWRTTAARTWEQLMSFGPCGSGR